MTRFKGRRERRLTIVSGQFYPKEGGAEKQLREVGARLACTGWRVTVVTGAPRGLPSSETLAPNFRVIRLEPSYFSRQETIQGLEMLARSQPTLARIPTDVLVASLVSAASYGALLSSVVLRRPLVLRLGGVVRHGPEVSQHDAMAFRALVRRARFVVAPAHHLLDPIRDLDVRSREKCRVIPNGVNAPQRLRQVAGERDSAGGPVTFYTNGGPEKNDAAFIRIVQMNPETQFVAVGHVEQLPSLPNLYRRGWLDDPSALIAESAVVLNTSTSEGSPNFCLQALALGTPVVGFAIPALTELQRRFTEGVYLAEGSDPSQLTAVIQARPWEGASVEGRVETVDSASEQWDDLLCSAVGG